MNKLGFHESDIVSFYISGKDVVVKLQRVHLNNTLVDVDVVVANVSEIVMDDGVNPRVLRWVPEMEAPDGEVLTLELCDDKILLIVEWTDFSKRNSFTRVYDIAGGKVSAVIIGESEDVY